MNKLLRKLDELRIVKAFKLNTTPRWVILLIDMLIVVLSYAITVASDIYALHTMPDALKLLTNLVVVVAVYFVVTYFSKSYTCIIRLSVIEDLYRIFLAVVVSSALLIVINVIVNLFTGAPLLRYWSLIIIGALAFSMMMIERLAIKYLYMRLTMSSDHRRRVLVLGTSLDSLILANALQNEFEGKYRPVGLLSISDSDHKEKSQINGFNVYRFHPETIASVFKENRISALIFSAGDKKLMNSGFADYFIRENIHLLSINKVEEFELDDNKSGKANISSFIKEVQIEDLLSRDPIVLNNTLVKAHIQGSCVLITGACGSIGSEIVRQVASYHARKIVLIDQAETPMHEMQLEMEKDFPNCDIALWIGDVQNLARMELAFKTFKPEYVFHAAAYKHVPMMEINPTEAVLTNVQGTKNIADLALKYGAYKFVMVSTDKAVNPTNVMGCTKRIAEIYCQSLFFDARQRGMKTQYITTRFGNVLGSNGSVIPLFRKQIAEGGPVTVTHRDIIRYFMTIPEACSLVLEAGCMGHGGEIYIFDMGEPVRIYDLARRMISLSGLKPDVDIEIKEVGLRPGEKLYEELLNDKEQTTATANKKILIAKVRTYDYRTVTEHIEEIVDSAADGNVHEMILEMKRFVPEYKSNHSKFEKIDKEIEENKTDAVLQTPETEIYY